MKPDLVVVSTCLHASTPDRCRQSVASQTLPVRHIFIEASLQVEPKTHSENLFDAVQNLDPDTVVLQLDGDDWFAHPHVAAQIADLYKDPAVWLTYGSFSTEDGRYHETNAPYAPNEDVRTTPWRCSHLKTFRAGLFQRIDSVDLKLPDGTWTNRAVDHATMFPMIEMAGWDRTRWVKDILYVYGESGTDPSLGEATAVAAQLFRGKRRYPRLASYRRDRLSRNLDVIYDDQFFSAYRGLQREDIRTAAESVFRLLSPKRVLDVGAGPGQFVGRLRELGVDAWGLDGSARAFDHADDAVRHYLWQEDITAAGSRDFGVSPPYDLVTCMEVAEHVPDESADALVRKLCRSCAPGGAVLLTAAPIGQGGHDHINCQPLRYWIAKFGTEGFAVDEAATAAVKGEWVKIVRMPWYGQNVLIFRAST